MLYEDFFVEDFEEDEEEWETYEDEISNAPCDNAGFCVGAACPFFHTCQG